MPELQPDVLARIREAEAILPVAAEPVTEDFLSFYDRERAGLAELLRNLKAATPRVAAFELSAGAVPPGAAIIDERIKGYCGIPYRTPNGLIPECPGLTRGLFGCPPHAPPVSATVALLQQAQGLVLMQFAGREGSAPQGEVHHFMLKAVKAVREAGYEVLDAYASGPCRVCPKGCGDAPECRLPDRRLFALEACGFWVNALVDAGSPYPVLGDSPAPVEWLIDWRLDTQNTDAIRYTGGILVGRRNLS